MAYDRGLADRVRSILERRAGFSERQMFGGIAFMIDGHMCCGVMKTDLMLRLAPHAVVSGLRKPAHAAYDLYRQTDEVDDAR